MDESPHTSTSFSKKNIDQSIMFDLYFCKFLTRVLELMKNVNIVQSPYTQTKLHYMILKNVIIKMDKLETTVYNPRIYNQNLVVEKLQDSVFRSSNKYRNELK